jgi:hypothetical protein
MILMSRTRAAQLFTVVALAASAWGLIDPRPYPLAMGLLAILPWLAIVISAHWRRSPGGGGDNASQPDLLLPLMLPGCILGLRAVLDVQVLAGWLPFLPAAVIALLMTLVIRRAQSERQIALWLYLLIFIPVTAFYGYGSTVLANKILDQAPPKMYLRLRSLGQQDQPAYRARSSPRALGAAQGRGECRGAAPGLRRGPGRRQRLRPASSRRFSHSLVRGRALRLTDRPRGCSGIRRARQA